MTDNQSKMVSGTRTAAAFWNCYVNTDFSKDGYEFENSEGCVPRHKAQETVNAWASESGTVANLTALNFHVPSGSFFPHSADDCFEVSLNLGVSEHLLYLYRVVRVRAQG